VTRQAEDLDLADVQEAAEIRAALRSFLRVTEAIVRRHDLTPQRYLLLLMIKGAPDGSERSTVSELCERLELAQSTVTELVQRAEEVGLVRRDASERDGRVAHLLLTDEGEARFARAFLDMREERERLLMLLGHVHEGLRAAGPSS
jgi:DNA-binding MarR family transcriptional regulator